MFKKLLKAAKIFTTAKATKETLDNLTQPEKDTEDKIREAVKDSYKTSKQAQKAIDKLGFTPSRDTLKNRNFVQNYSDKTTNLSEKLSSNKPPDKDILKKYVINMKTKNLKSDTVNTPTKVNLSDSLNPDNHRFAKMLENTPDMLETAMAEARFFAKISVCQKAKVGCAIFDDDHILSIGYNANRSYHFSCDGSECQVAGKNNSTNCGIVHAEIVAVENLELSEHYGNQKYAYVTQFPCTQCLYQLQKEGIKEVFYSDKNYFIEDLVRMNPDITFTQV